MIANVESKIPKIMMKEAKTTMKLLPIFYKTIISTLALTSLLGCSSIIAETNSYTVNKSKSQTSTFNLDEVSCWDVMTLESEERDYLLFLLYGYSSGVVAKNEQSGEGIKNALISVGTYCADNPDDLVIDVFKNTLTN